MSAIASLYLNAAALLKASFPTIILAVSSSVSKAFFS